MAAMGASIEEQMAVATPGADGVGDGIGSDDDYSEDLYVFPPCSCVGLAESFSKLQLTTSPTYEPRVLLAGT